jgi:hypothetical protein
VFGCSNNENEDFEISRRDGSCVADSEFATVQRVLIYLIGRPRDSGVVCVFITAVNIIKRKCVFGGERDCVKEGGGGEGERERVRLLQGCSCVFITAVPIIKLFAWGEGDSGGHVLRETTSRGLC